MTIIEKRQKGGGGTSTGAGAGAGAGAAGGAGRGGSGTGGTVGGGTTGGGVSSGGTTGGGTKGGGTTGGGISGGGTTGGSKGGNTGQGSGTTGGGTTGNSNSGGNNGGGSAGGGSAGNGGGRGTTGSGGAMPGAGGAGNGPKIPSGGPLPNPRNIGPPSGLNFGGEQKLASAYGRGGGPPAVIRVGQPFAGRSEGGKTREQIFGTKIYGSGYADNSVGRGVANRPFPFYFWPVVWGGAVVSGGAAYLDATDEYGDVNNSTRPGGALSSIVFRSPSNNSTFRVMADGNSTSSLLSDLSNNCSSTFSANPAPVSTPLDVNTTEPKPEEAIQYY